MLRFTKKRVVEVLAKVDVICFCHMFQSGIFEVIEVSGRERMVIFIDTIVVRYEEYPPKQLHLFMSEAEIVDEYQKYLDHQILTFIHELVHAFNCIHSIPDLECAVERKARQFYKSNREFSRKLFKEVLASPKKIGSQQLLRFDGWWLKKASQKIESFLDGQN